MRCVNESALANAALIVKLLSDLSEYAELLYIQGVH